jgi:hypothetical protein
MRATIVSGLLASLLTLASAQVREVWRYVYTPPQDDLAAHLERAVRLSDGGLMLLGWVETPLNGRDALAIRLLPSGAEAWVYQVDGAGFDDAFVDAIESADELRLLGQFTDADGYLAAQVLVSPPQVSRAGYSPSAAPPTATSAHCGSATITNRMLMWSPRWCMEA